MKATDVIRNLGPGVTLFPGLVKVFGRNEALLLAQLIYWTPEKPKWIYKVSDEIERMTTLSWREQKSARKNLVACGVLEEYYNRSIAQVGFKVDSKRVNELFCEAIDGNAIAPNAIANQLKRDCQSTQTRLLPSEKSRENIKNSKNVARSAHDAGPAGFFGKEQTSFELQAAKRLFDLLAAKRKIFRKVNIKAWAKEFAQLQEGGVDRKRIKAAVKFYSKVIGEDYIPQIYSAKAFCLKFAQLEDAMKKRSSPSGTKGDSDNITVSDEAQRIAEDLGESYPWPKGLGSQLAPVVQKSLDNLREFDAKRKAAVKLWKKLTHSEMAKIAQRAQRMLDFDTEITGGWLSGTDAEFVAAWFANVSKRLAKWKDFNSSLAYFTFSITHADADARGRQEAVEWTGSDEVWTKYISRINES